MKYLITALLLFGFMVTNAQNAIDGNWKGTRETPNGTMELNYTLSFNGNNVDFTGELVSDDQIVTKNERGETKLSRVKE